MPAPQRVGPPESTPGHQAHPSQIGSGECSEGVRPHELGQPQSQGRQPGQQLLRHPWSGQGSLEGPATVLFGFKLVGQAVQQIAQRGPRGLREADAPQQPLPGVPEFRPVTQMAFDSRRRPRTGFLADPGGPTSRHDVPGAGSATGPWAPASHSGPAGWSSGFPGVRDPQVPAGFQQQPGFPRVAPRTQQGGQLAHHFDVVVQPRPRCRAGAMEPSAFPARVSAGSGLLRPPRGSGPSRSGCGDGRQRPAGRQEPAGEPGQHAAGEDHQGHGIDLSANSPANHGAEGPGRRA